jgi:cytoskeletal protein CcmA (bactofilin family)
VSRPLAGLLGDGAVYRGDLVFDGRVRIDGTLIGTMQTEDLVEISRTGRVEGEIYAVQALVAGTVVGVIEALERCTLLETASVKGEIITPWLDVRIGCQLDAKVRVEREGDKP